MKTKPIPKNTNGKAGLGDTVANVRRSVRTSKLSPKACPYCGGTDDPHDCLMQLKLF